MSGRWQTELGKGRAAQSRRDVLRAFAWLLRKLFLSCVFKESFLARLASRCLLADMPSFSSYLHLCLLSSKGKRKKKRGRKNTTKFTWFSWTRVFLWDVISVQGNFAAASVGSVCSCQSLYLTSVQPNFYDIVHPIKRQITYNIKWCHIKVES